MAIVTVYNRDGTEYGTLDTKQYIFNNNLIGFEPVKLDTKIYQYVKINGVYYKNDGEEFFSRGRSDNSAGLQGINDAFCINYSSPLYKINIGEDDVYTGKDANSTVIKSSSGDSISKVGGYGVSGKALIGTFQNSLPSTDYGYFYSKSFTRQDGKSIEKPLYGTFNPGKPFIVYSNLDVIKSSGGTSTGEDVSGYAPQPGSIDEKTFWGRDEIDRATDKETDWWGSYRWLRIESEGPDNDGTGHSSKNGSTYIWDNAFPAARPVKIQSYTPNTETVTINPSTGVVNNVENLIEAGQKIILVKRPLISLQKLIDDSDLRRFLFIYGTGNEVYGDTPMVLACNGSPDFQLIWFSNSQPMYFENQGNLCTGSSGGTSFGQYGCFNWFERKLQEGEEVVELDIELPNLEFYDVTSLITSETTISNILNSISSQNKITPIGSRDIVSTTTQDVEFNFSSPVDELYYCHGGVKYKFHITNIQSLKKDAISKTPDSTKRHTLYGTHLADKRHGGSRPGSTISSSVLFTDVFYGETPLGFTDHFVNLGHESLGVVHTGGNSYNGASPIKTDTASNSEYVSYTKVDSGSDNPDFECRGGVAGGRNGINDTRKKHIAPVMTSYDEGTMDKIEGKYMANVRYLNPFSPYDTRTLYSSWYALNDNMRNGLGTQVGLTTGIVINYPDINSIDTVDGILPTATEDAVAIIVCDTY